MRNPEIQFWLAVLAPALLFTMGTSVPGEAEGPDFFRISGIASGDVLNVREEPSTSARRVGALPPDADGIRNLGCQGGLSLAQWQAASPQEREAGPRNRWCRIAFDGVEGWVAGRFLAESGTSAPATGSCFGPSFKDLFGQASAIPPVDSALRRKIMQHRFERYRLIALHPVGSAVRSGTWVGSLWLPEPPDRKAVLMASVTLGDKTFINWAYLNRDGSVSKKFVTGEGAFVGVLTIAPSGTILLAFDRDGDRMIDLAEILAADGRQSVWIREDQNQEILSA